MNLHPAEFPRGTVTPAGMGYATAIPDMDFETYSEAGHIWVPAASGGGKWQGPRGAAASKKGLGVIGTANYATHPTTEVLDFAYNLKDGRGLHRWRPGMPPPHDLFDYLRAGGLVEGWNVAFEWWIWNYVCTRRYGWPTLDMRQTRCAMAKARASSYPGALGIAGSVMNLVVKKDARGDALLKKFSVPQKPTKGDKRTRHLPSEFPEEGQALSDYNVIDIVSEAEASYHVPDLEGEELEFWLADQAINRRGVAVDTESLAACVVIVQECITRYNEELRTLTGGAVEAASQLERLKGWLAGCGIHMADGRGSMDEEAILAQLAIMKARGWEGSAPYRALQLRGLIGSASVKKVFAMTNTLSPWGRLHDLFNYHGARTGRPTGEGPQPTNLPKAGPNVYRCLCGKHFGAKAVRCPWCHLPAPTKKASDWSPEATEDALEIVRTRSVSAVEYFFGDAMLTVSGCLRGLFVAAPGHELICSDFSSIEGVVTACLAGEDWRVEMFATHGKAYELSVAKITGIPFAEIMQHAGYDDVERPEWWKHRSRHGPHHPMRQTLGKVAELASGFGGWINAWKRFGADEFMSDDDIKKGILAWREASPAIVEFWGGQERRNGWQRIPELFGLEGMAVAAILQPETEFPVMRRDGAHSGITYIFRNNALYCRLPSGRYLTYHRARLVPNMAGRAGQAIEFEGYNTNPTMGAVGWVTMNTYGGKLCENVVQATARDIQRFAIINEEKRGYPVVLHVYDEIVSEVPEGFGSIEEFESIMGTMPAWAVYKGVPWPIKANGGWRGRRYRKG